MTLKIILTPPLLYSKIHFFFFVASDGSPANVNIIRHIPAEKAMIVGGNFNSIDSLACTSICSLNTVNFQWNTLGSGLVGEVHDFLLINVRKEKKLSQL